MEEKDHDDNYRLYPVGRSPNGGVIRIRRLSWAGLDAVVGCQGFGQRISWQGEGHMTSQAPSSGSTENKGALSLKLE